MATLTLRSAKGAPLTNNEVDANFSNLNADVATRLTASSNLSDLTNTTIARSNLGLSNVENKSSATIRGEITSGNVTTALGYTPVNPSTSQSANSVYAAPNGTAGAPSFRALVAADVPTLNQNTTGTASNVTGTVAITNGGTGQTTANSAFNALAPTQTGNSGKYLLTDGTNTSWAAVQSGAALSNDTTTATNLYPIFANATTGAPTTVYTSNAKYLYKPSTGELKASEMVATNGIFVNATTINSDYLVETGFNAHAIGPMTVATGKTVTVSSGQRFLIL